MRILICLFIFLSGKTAAVAQPDYKSWDTFLKKYVSASGDVDYKSIKANKKELEAITKAFSETSVSTSWSKNDQLAFWINAYNVFTIDLIVNHYPIKSIQNLDGGKPWDVKRIAIGGKKYSLNNLENDIIRPQFKDARIHFAVNCAAKSCPPILNGAFFGKSLDEQLDAVTKKFISNTKYQNITSGKMTLSKIFDWYKVDFGDIFTFINKYSTIKVNKNTAIVYKEYDWSLNEKK
ncbi:MAG: DUF547 domain-containing protein [Saprospiraceae bacterium]|nr:DUF547 domain-containing protein [Saprospiraceae bacterium]MBP6568709.1 DUF547 domain-containing protein [Saprospiraceae bacterium]